MDLIEFLKQRLDGDERIAEEAVASGDDYHGMACQESPEWIRYGSHYDTARTGAEVAAKRAIVEEYAKVLTMPNDSVWVQPYRDGLEYVVSHLAAIYSDHPDYNHEEWKP